MIDPIEKLATELLDAAIQVGDENRMLAPGGMPDFIESTKRLFAASTEISKRLHPELPARAAMNGKIHCVKCWPETFAALVRGEKLFDIRRNDRGYRVGDVLVSREWSPLAQVFSGEIATHRILYVLPLAGEMFDGFPEGFVCMTIKPWSIPRDVEQRIRRGEL